MNDIPWIVEQLYYELVVVPAPQDWPEYLGKDPVVIHSLYAFYDGLRAGFQLSGALGEQAFSLCGE